MCWGLRDCSGIARVHLPSLLTQVIPLVVMGNGNPLWMKVACACAIVLRHLKYARALARFIKYNCAIRFNTIARMRLADAISGEFARSENLERAIEILY